MEVVTNVVNFLTSPAGAGLFAGLFMVSEALASIPALRANSVFQLMSAILQRMVKKNG